MSDSYVRVSRFEAGDMVRILDDGSEHHLRHYVPIGDVVEIAEQASPGTGSVMVADGQYVPFQSIEHADEQPEGPKTLPRDRTEFELDLHKVFGEAEELLLRKHHDYGPTNIGRSPGGPLNGIRVRIWDKQARINNLIESGAEPANESLRDSFLDLLNYSAIALVVMDGNWPE